MILVIISRRCKNKMGLKEKLKELKAKAEEMKQRGRIITEQQRAEKLRRKSNKISSMKPGAHRAIVEGIAMKQKPWEVAGYEYSRRKYEREKKYHGKSKDSGDKD
jgi:hypothetical protein